MNEELFTHDLEVLKHINKVREKLLVFIFELDKRGQAHDASKLQSPEREIFAKNNHKLAITEYGSEEYKKLLEEVKPAIDHHYSKNTHHPEHRTAGIDGMDLMDLVEMIADWSAATERNKGGNVHKSIEHNTKRYNISPQLAQILTNTVDRYF